MTADTEQSKFWRGDFGDAYVDRNSADAATLRARVELWSRVLAPTKGAPPASMLEVGANIGINLRALRCVTGADLWAVEPNTKARGVLVDEGVVGADRVVDAIATSIPLADGAVDLAFTSGVLIHIHPDDLLRSCREIHRVSRRYIACIEYFSDKPEEINYRGHDGFLFKRDFGGFWMDSFPDLQLLDYGFTWKRATGLDNLTWWIFEKR